MGQVYIGIDLGTTFLKGALIDIDKSVISTVLREPFPGFIDGMPPTRREVDPRAVMTAVRELIGRLLAGGEKCAGLVICTQMHGLVVTDSHGQPLTNITTWLDQRTLESAQNREVSSYAQMSHIVTDDDRLTLGNDLSAGRPLSVLYWMKQQNAAGAAQGGKYPCSLADFVAANLCHSEPCTDVTNSAAHGAFNLRSGTWHFDLIKRLELPAYHWPHIVPEGALVGHFEVHGQRIACYVPVGDHQCALLGSLLQDDELSINASTGSQVGVLATRLNVSLEYQTRPYFDDRYLKAVIHIPAGRSLNALLRLLSELADARHLDISDPWGYIEMVTTDAPDTDLQMDLAFFASSCGNRGAITGIREGNLTIRDLFTAAFNNMADNYAACGKLIAQGTRWNRMVFAGGLLQKFTGLRRAILRQLPLPYRFAPTSEDTMLGLTVMAQVCAGNAKTFTEASQLVATHLSQHDDSVSASVTR